MLNIDDLFVHKKLLNKMYDIITKLLFLKKSKRKRYQLGVIKKLLY